MSGYPIAGGTPAGQPDPLIALGWNTRLQQAFADHSALGHTPGRVTRVDRGSAAVATARGEQRAGARAPTGGPGAPDSPVTGDWVAIEHVPGSAPVIAGVLPRASAFRRFRDGAVQVLAANIHVAFVVMAAGVGDAAGSAGRHRLAVRSDGRVRRLDRELALAFESGAQPVIVLSKADLCPDLDAVIGAVTRTAPQVPIHATSGVSGEGVDRLRTYAAGNRTLALIGASGVGKSTIANRLLGTEALTTSAVREDDGRGRHTTTARHLFALPGGGALIDTPGLRSLGLWDAAVAVDQVYADIAALAASCRFHDCAHESEPGCAVRAAIAEGELTAERLDAYRKLQREAALEERKHDPRKQAEERERQRSLFAGYRKRSRQRAKSRWRDEQ